MEYYSLLTIKNEIGISLFDINELDLTFNQINNSDLHNKDKSILYILKYIKTVIYSFNNYSILNDDLLNIDFKEIYKNLDINYQKYDMYIIKDEILYLNELSINVNYILNKLIDKIKKKLYEYFDYNIYLEGNQI